MIAFFEKNIRNTTLLFILITVAAALFRVTYLNYIEFKTDEGINIFLASRPLFGHAMPPGGTVSSVGVLNFPLLNYTLFPALLLSTDPRFLSLYIGVINSLAIGIFFIFLKKYYGLIAALVTSLLMASAPWAVLYSRKIWAQDLIVPFFVLLFISVHKILIDKKKKYWFLYCLAGLLLLQIHQANMFFLLPLTVFLFLKKPVFSKRAAIVGLLLGFIPVIPFLFFQLQHGCPDCSAVLSVSNRLSDKNLLVLFLRPLQIINQGNFHSVMGDDMLPFSTQFSLIFSLRRFLYLEYLLLPIGCFVYWKKYKALRPLLYAALCLPFLYLLGRIDPLLHYFIIIMPLLFLCVGILLAELLQNKKGIVKGVTLVSVTGLIVISFLFDYSFFAFLKQQKGLKGDYGTTFLASEENRKKMFSAYRSDEKYKEMLIASYVPLNVLYGDLPIPRMLFDHETIKKNIPELDTRLKRIPIDPLTRQQLFAYYTDPLTKKQIELLREKSRLIPGYRPLYVQAYDFYLSKNYKKLFVSDAFQLAFEYPQHWKIKESYPESIILSGDDALQMKIQQTTQEQLPPLPNATFTTSIISLLHKNVSKKECQIDNSWCGTYIFPVTHQSRTYEFIIEQETKQLIGKKTKIFQNQGKTYSDILDSMRNSNKEVLQ